MTPTARSRALKRLWDRRVEGWSDTVESSPVFAVLRSRLLELAQPQPADRCLDLGAGSGFLTIPLAQQTANVHAVDLSAGMLASLRAQADQTGDVTITTQIGDMAGVAFAPASYDLVVSAYAMHYLLDPQKLILLRRAYDWLAPGGRLLVSDMMLGRSLDQHHRRVFADKAGAMLRHGPAGWWRLAKNIGRIALKRGRLHPCTPAWWSNALTEAGFTHVTYEHVSSEAGIVRGQVRSR